MKLYHYTIADRLCKIFIDGFIKTSTVGIDASEVPYVWLTKSEEWDKTAFYGYPSELITSHGRIRITLSKSFKKVIRYNKIKIKIPLHNSLEVTAREVSVNPLDWFVSENKIPISFIEKVELWKDKKWIEIPIFCRRQNEQVAM